MRHETRLCTVAFPVAPSTASSGEQTFGTQQCLYHLRDEEIERLRNIPKVSGQIRASLGPSPDPMELCPLPWDHVDASRPLPMSRCHFCLRAEALPWETGDRAVRPDLSPEFTVSPWVVCLPFSALQLPHLQNEREGTGDLHV